MTLSFLPVYGLFLMAAALEVPQPATGRATPAGAAASSARHAPATRTEPAPHSAQNDGGARWFGIVWFRHTWDDGGARGERQAQARLRLREGPQQAIPDPRAPMGSPVMSFAMLVHDGTTIEETLDATGGLAAGPGQRCTGSGSARVSGDAGMVWRNLSGGDVSAAAGFPIPRNGTYLINQIAGSANTAPASYPVRCAPGSASEASFFVGPFGQGVPYTSAAQLADNGMRMVGRAAWSEGDHQYELVWSICREGVTCPPPPGPAPAPAPAPAACREPKTEKALLNLTLDEQKAASDLLAARFDQYFVISNQARALQGEFEFALNTCNRIRDLHTLVRLLAGQGPTNVRNAARLLTALKNILVDTDSTFVVENYVANRLGVQKIWDTMMFHLNKLGPATAPSPREQLMSCAGYALDEVFKDAMKFVQLMEQAEPLMREIHELLNDMRNRDEEELFSRWSQYQAACRDYAACMGLPAATCDTLPPR